MGPRAVYIALAILVLLLFVHLRWNPALLLAASVRGLGPKVAVSILSIAPLGFLMGVPFPFVLRQGQERIAPAAAAILFALVVSPVLHAEVENDIPLGIEAVTGIRSSYKCRDVDNEYEQVKARLAGLRLYLDDGLEEECRRAGCLPGWIR